MINLDADSGRELLPWETSPHRLWNLWDMIRIALSKYIQLGAEVQNADNIFETLKALTETPNLGIVGSPADIIPIKRLSEQERAEVAKALAFVARAGSELSLPISVDLAERALNELPETLREYRMLITCVQSELKSKNFFYIPDHRARYFEWDDIISPAAQTAFPSAAKEIREAGNCYAAGLYTACVFHSMRGAEIGVRKMAEQLQVPLRQPLELTEWGVIQDGIDSKIKDMKQQPRTMQRDEDQRFYSEAAAQLRYFKDGWRSRAAHGRETFGEQQALTVLDHTRSFFEIIAPRLSE